MKLDLILENIRNKYSLGLLEESEGMDEKQILQGKILINESTMAIRSMLVENGVLDTVKDYLTESWEDLLQEELSPIAKRGMTLAGVGAGTAMAHAGAFGGGAKGLVDSAGSMGAGMVDRAATVVGDKLQHTGNYYSSSPSVAGPAAASAHEAVQKSHAAADAAHDAADDDDGIGVLGTLGALGAAGGAAYLANKTGLGKKLGSMRPSTTIKSGKPTVPGAKRPIRKTATGPVGTVGNRPVGNRPVKPRTN